MIAFLRDLVRIPTVWDPAAGRNEGLATDLLAQTLRGFGWDPLIEEVAPGRPNVVTVVEGGLPGPTLLFEGHVDVVTEGDPAAWTRDPFSGTIEGGRLHGRGSADMKAGIAAMIFATAAVAAGGPFPGRIVLACLADEEGLMLGVKDFVRRGQAAGIDAAIVCEPEADEVCIAQKGAIRLRFDARGRMAHGAMPEHGRNPVAALARLAERLPAVAAGMRARHGRHELLGDLHITPTVFAAGSLPQLNVIPETALMAADVRTLPATGHAQLLALLEAECEAVSAATEVAITMTVIDDRPPTSTPVDHPIVRALVTAHERVTGSAPPLGGVPGATDGTILWRDAGIPIVTYGPGGKWIAHQVDEYVEVADVVRAARVYAEAARIYLRS